jgi:hypothetical protein
LDGTDWFVLGRDSLPESAANAVVNYKTKWWFRDTLGWLWTETCHEHGIPQESHGGRFSMNQKPKWQMSKLPLYVAWFTKQSDLLLYELPKW